MGYESDVIRDRPGGNLISSGTANIYMTKNGVTPTPVAITAGFFELEYDGCGGPTSWSVTANGETRVRESRAVGLVGATSMGDLPYALMALGNGVGYQVKNGLQVIDGGTGRTVRIRSGVALGAGIIYNQFTDNMASPTFATNVNGNNWSRIDTVVVRCYTPKHAEQGRAEIAILQGTAAASPVAPALTQVATAGIWEEPLADVTLPQGFSSITIGQITDRRTFYPKPTTVPVVRDAKWDIKQNTSASGVGVTDTVGIAISDLSGSLVLDAGVTYDVLLLPVVVTVPGNTNQQLQIAPWFVSATQPTNMAQFIGSEPTNQADNQRIPVVNPFFVKGILGTGAAVNYGVQARRVSSGAGTPQFMQRTLVVIAVPRTA